MSAVLNEIGPDLTSEMRKNLLDTLIGQRDALFPEPVARWYDNEAAAMNAVIQWPRTGRIQRGQ